MSEKIPRGKRYRLIKAQDVKRNLFQFVHWIIGATRSTLPCQKSIIPEN